MAAQNMPAAEIDITEGPGGRSASTRRVSRVPPVWLHGDLHTANLLVSEGALPAVIDFGDITSADTPDFNEWELSCSKPSSPAEAPVARLRSSGLVQQFAEGS